jgi:hypothetical protein
MGWGGKPEISLRVNVFPSEAETKMRKIGNVRPEAHGGALAESSAGGD